MRRKGVYPYEYMHSWNPFDERKLQPKESFYSRLNMNGIEEKHYNHAQNVWNTLSMHNIGQYHNNLQTDVLLLADVFETFRHTCLEHYKLDPAHFYTSPGLAW